jgi:hypothetical protein
VSLASLLRLVPDATTFRHISPLLNRSEAQLRLPYSTMSSGSGSTEDVRSRGQQPVLASQRAKEQSRNDPNQGNRGGFSYFPLGYKEGFSQWVGNPQGRLKAAGALLNVRSGPISLRLRLNIMSCLMSPTSRNRSPMSKPRPQDQPLIPLWL